MLIYATRFELICYDMDDTLVSNLLDNKEIDKLFELKDNYLFPVPRSDNKLKRINIPINQKLVEIAKNINYYTNIKQSIITNNYQEYSNILSSIINIKFDKNINFEYHGLDPNDPKWSKFRKGREIYRIDKVEFIKYYYPNINFNKILLFDDNLNNISNMKNNKANAILIDHFSKNKSQYLVQDDYYILIGLCNVNLFETLSKNIKIVTNDKILIFKEDYLMHYHKIKNFLTRNNYPNCIKFKNFYSKDIKDFLENLKNNIINKEIYDMIN